MTEPTHRQQWTLRRRVAALCLLAGVMLAFLAVGAVTTAVANRGQLDRLLDDVGPMRTGANSLSTALVNQETAVRVREVLKKLPDKYRTVMSLRELDNLSCKEIAAIVHSTHATVRWRLHIARRMFKEHWERMERTRSEGMKP